MQRRCSHNSAGSRRRQSLQKVVAGGSCSIPLEPSPAARFVCRGVSPGLGAHPGQDLACGGGGAKRQPLNVKLPRLHTRVAEPDTVKSERAEKGKSEPGWKSEAILGTFSELLW